MRTSLSGSHLPVALILVVATCLLASCSSSNPSDAPAPAVIVVTDAEHHLGDNSGSEGQTYEGSFTLSGSFGDVEVRITFLYPNNAGQSGPEIDSPPDIMVNGEKIGLFPVDFPDNEQCVSQYREYECDVTLTKDATEAVVEGLNTIQVVAQGAAHPGDDDFVFTDLEVLVYSD